MKPPTYRDYPPSKARRSAALQLWACPDSTDDRPAAAKEGTKMRRPRFDRLKRYADWASNLPAEKRTPGSIYDELGQDLPALLAYIEQLESGLLRIGAAAHRSPEWLEAAALAPLGVTVPRGYHYDYSQRALVKTTSSPAKGPQNE